MANGSAETRLSKNTWLPIGAVVACVVLAFTSGVWATSIKSDIEDIGASLEEIKAILKGTISHDEMAQWIELLKARNPGASLDIPDFPK